MKTFSGVIGSFLLLGLASWLALAEEPDGLTLPPGFHATVVAEGLGPTVRHLAVRQNGDVYVSTLSGGIIVLHLDANHKSDLVQHFSAVEGGTGIGFYDGALYATTGSRVYRFTFSSSNELVPESKPEVIVDGMPETHPGFRRANRPLAFDGKGDLFISLDDGVNDFCVKPDTPDGAPPVEVKPCPYLVNRAGIWRFHANKVGQKFPADGEQLATGVRDMTALAWSPADRSLYGIMHGRDNMHKTWPNLISIEDESQIADEMDRVAKGTDFGWPYTYYDGVRKVRLVSPGYGGDGKAVAPAGVYSTPVVSFTPRSAPVGLVFYAGDNFPAAYRGGAFIALHGTRGKNGYDVVFVPFNRHGMRGSPTVFANGFAAFDSSANTSVSARYRPVGLAVGPDGALYISDSQKGRIWRVAYKAGRSSVE